MERKERNSSIELLRIFTMASVLTGHSFGFGAQGEVPYGDIMLMFNVSINLFILISGYYQIHLKTKTFLNTAGMVVFYSFLSTVVWSCITGEVNLNYWVSAFLPVSHNRFYWFMACYLMLMLLSPMINKGLAALTNKQLIYLVIVVVYINCISGWLFKHSINSNGFHTMQFILMYILGYAIRHFDVDNKVKVWHALTVFIAISVLFVLLRPYTPQRLEFTYNHPLEVLRSLAVFCIFLKIQFHSRVINHIASCAFPCYLLSCGSAGNLFFSVQYQVWLALQSPIGYLVFSVVCAIAFFLLSMLLEPLRKAIMGRLENLLYNRLHLEKIDSILEQKR